LSNRENRLIKTLECHVYILRISRNKIFCLDKNDQITVIPFDVVEYNFNIVLLNQTYDNVIKIGRNSNLCGLTFSKKVQNKGFPELAIHLNKDKKFVSN